MLFIGAVWLPDQTSSLLTAFSLPLTPYFSVTLSISLVWTRCPWLAECSELNLNLLIQSRPLWFGDRGWLGLEEAVHGRPQISRKWQETLSKQNYGWIWRHYNLNELLLNPCSNRHGNVLINISNNTHKRLAPFRQIKWFNLKHFNKPWWNSQPK